EQIVTAVAVEVATERRHGVPELAPVDVTLDHEAVRVASRDARDGPRRERARATEDDVRAPRLTHRAGSADRQVHDPVAIEVTRGAHAPAEPCALVRSAAVHSVVAEEAHVRAHAGGRA